MNQEFDEFAENYDDALNRGLKFTRESKTFFAEGRMRWLARRWSLWYQEYPVLLSPVWTQPAFPLDFDIASLEGAIATLELMRPVLPANLLGTPAAVVPAGMADGLPVGVQVMGGKYTELRCLAVAETIEQRLGTLTPIDPVTG